MEVEMSQINSNQDGSKGESETLVGELQTLRDEIRLKLHLAGAEAHDAWNKLEPQLTQLEHKVGEAAESTVNELRSAGSELKANFQKFYQSLHKP
jgi:hypothetical protein